MRVIAGEFKGRTLQAPEGTGTRPTPDRLREALFNILAPRIEGVTFVDAYAGSGAVGIEALSRGAALSVFLEKDRLALMCLKRNLSALGIEARARVMSGLVKANLGKAGGGIVFLDPPYALEKEYERAMALLENSPALVIVQHEVHFKLPESRGTLRLHREVRQGSNVLSFYSAD